MTETTTKTARSTRKKAEKPENATAEKTTKKTATRKTSKKKAEPEKVEEKAEVAVEEVNVSVVNESKEEQKQPVQEKPLTFVTPTMVIRDIVELGQAPLRQIVISDQQIQQLTLEQAEERHLFLENTLARVLDYDVVLSDTNVWLELLVGHTSSHSDPRVNARLQFERQLEFISKMTRFRKGKFMMMAETYEEIDRFATQQEPTNYHEADFSDQALCRNVAARLAKRLILSQQRENRLRIEGIGAESHHSAFADPAIIRRTVEFFAKGKKVLLITNDASVAIRSMGLCDDLQRFNNIDDETWERDYAPLRPMACTFDDLKMLDQYTRQYHFLQQASGKQWMEDVPQLLQRNAVAELKLWMEAFRPGDRHRSPLPQMPVNQQKQKEQPKKQEEKHQEQPKKQEPKRPEQKKGDHNKKQQKPQQQQGGQPTQQQSQQPQQQSQQPQQQSPQQQQAEPVSQPTEIVAPNVEMPKTVEVENVDAQAAPVAENVQHEEQKPKRRPQRRGGRKPRKQSEEPAKQAAEASE